MTTAVSGTFQTMNASLYVGDLAPDVTEAIIFETFNAVGPVASVRVCRDANTQRSLGYAYVNFHRVEDAERALLTMNYKNIRGRQCRIMWSHRDPSLRKSGAGNVFVKNLAAEIDNKTLYDTFSVVGNILSCKVATNRQGESLGYGFVHYESEKAAREAIEGIDGKEIAGKLVSVEVFKSLKERRVGANNWTNVFIKNLPESTTETELKEKFGKFGEITSLKLGNVTEAKGAQRKTRHAFVNFQSNESAVSAIEALHNTKEGDLELYVQRHQKKEERERELRRRIDEERRERQKQYRGVNLYVKNLSDDMDDDKLAQTFASYGQISSAKVMLDRTTGKSKGFGFVCYSSPEEATRAVTEMNGKMIGKKPLYVALAQRKEERRAQLEQFYATNRNKFPPGVPPMYSQPIFYQQQHGRPMMFPQAMPRQMMFPQGARVPTHMMPQMANRAPMNYQLMPAMVNNNARGQPGGQGGRRNQGRQRGQKGGPQAGGQQLRYNQNVRNQGQGQQQLPGGPAQQGQPQQRPIQGQASAMPTQGMVPQASVSSLSSVLASAPEERQRQMIGEQLFPLVQQRQPEKAGKITGMLLEMATDELLALLEDPAALDENITEALAVLDRDDEESDEEDDEEADEDN